MSAHGISLEVIERDESGHATTWLGTCGCKKRFVGETYEQTEDKWRRHIYEAFGTVERPMGDKTGRWTP